MDECKINDSCIVCQVETSAALCDECMMKHLGYRAVWAIPDEVDDPKFATYWVVPDDTSYNAVRIFVPINA